MHATTIFEKGIEYFVASDGKLYQFKNGVTTPFKKITIDDLTDLRRDLERNPEALKALRDMGIHEPLQELEQYTRCRYGGKNIWPDFVYGKPVNDTEYWECGKRNQCAYEGRLCSPLSCGENTLSYCETIVASHISKGFRNAEIAWATGKSIETVKAQIRSILQKIDGRSRVDIANFIQQKIHS